MSKVNAKRRRDNVISVDLSEVESGGKVSDGEYLVEVVEVESKDSSTGNPMLTWKFKVVEGGNGTLYHNTSLQPQALFNLRNTLEALEFDIPDSAFDIDLGDLVGLQCGVAVENEMYQGKKKPRITDLFPAKDFDSKGSSEDDGDDEPEPAPSKAPAKKTAEKVPAKKVIKKSEPEADAEIKKGSTVTFEDDGTEYEGTVTKINTKENFATVEVDGEDGAWEIDLDDLTLVS